MRQHGNFSFSRVFEAGHEIPTYKIVPRRIFGMNIATGEQDVSSSGNANSYSTSGASDSFSIKKEVPESPNPRCYVLSPSLTCTEEQQHLLQNGNPLVHNYVLIDANQTDLFPGTYSNMSSGNGSGNSAAGGSPEGPSNLPAGTGVPSSSSTYHLLVAAGFTSLAIYTIM